jgi:hypothetical protein
MKNFDSISKLDLSKFLDAIPTALFIADKENRILDVNQYATQLIDMESGNTISRLCGDVLHCMHTQDSIQECGTTDYCPDCVINNTIKESCSGQTIVKRKAELLIEKDNKKTKGVFLISASPYTDNERNLTILCLEDISEVVLLRSLLSICSKCNKIRDDKGYWNQFESYIEQHSDTSFSHGICPECSDKLYGEQDWYIKMKKDKGIA